MEVSAVKSVETAADYPGIKNNTKSQGAQKTGAETEVLKVQANKGTKAADSSESKDSKKLDKEDVEIANEALNAFMTAINSDLHFRIHEDTDIIMLQVVDRRDNKVIKEIPSHEMLDVIARIRESVGALLDKKV